MSPNLHTPVPWWERASFCAESSPPGCNYSFFTQLECQTEIGEDGVPVKRCIQLRKRLLNCPGREPMVDEHKQEVTTYPGAPQAPEHAEGYIPGLEQPQTRQAESQDVGQALEEVIRLAEDLQEGFLPSGGANVRLDTPPPGPSAVPWPPSEAPAQPEGLLSRLFKGSNLHPSRERARSSAYNSGSEPWRDYARDFQDA